MPHTIAVDPQTLAKLRAVYANFADRAAWLATTVDADDLDASFGELLNSTKPHFTDAKDTTRAMLTTMAQTMRDMRRLLQEYEDDIGAQEDGHLTLLREIGDKLGVFVGHAMPTPVPSHDLLEDLPRIPGRAGARRRFSTNRDDRRPFVPELHWEPYPGAHDTSYNPHTLQRKADAAYWDNAAGNDPLGRSADDLRRAHESRDAIYYEDLDRSDAGAGFDARPASSSANGPEVTFA